MLDVGLYLTYTLVAVAVISAIGFAVINSVRTPGALMKTLIAIGVLVVLFGLAYALSSDTVSMEGAALGITSTKSKLIGAGLILLYITLGGSILALIYSEISKTIK
jgi:hypothetical protein